MDQDAALSAMLARILDCDPEIVDVLLRYGRLRMVERSQCIVGQGELLGTIWLVVDGELKMESGAASGRVARLALGRPGEWIGSYARPTPSRADIIATCRSRLLAFPAGLLPRLADEFPRIGAAMALSFAQQLEGMAAKLDTRALLSAKGRVCSELLRRAEGLLICPVPVIAELAESALTTRETASRTVAELERRGIITRRSDGLQINSPRLLEDAVV